MINARAESVAERPAFREALKRRRCLVPADGFYEWQGRAGHRRPHHITLPEGELFAIAGLYENWLGAGGEAVETFTLMTQAATGAVAALHGRMPLILDPADYAGWLERGELAPDAIASFSQTRAGALVTRPIDTRVNDVRNDDPECLAPPAEPELPLFSS
jgi:putative SOS response-associated peptidase YedK